MKYNLIIKKLHNERTKKIFARQLAQNPAISLQKANDIVESPPFTLYNNIGLQEIKEHIRHLKDLGVPFNVVKANDSVISALPRDELKENKKEELNQTGPDKKAGLPEHYKHSFQTLEKKSSHYNSVKIDPAVEKKHSIASLITGIIIIVILAGTVSLLGNKREFIVTKKKVLPQKTSYQSDHSGKKSNKTDNSSGNYNSKREKVSFKEIKKSQSFVDSAKACSQDFNKAINFYKIAISFNRYNIHAWYGLIDAYKNSSMLEEMALTQKEMKDVFGENIFSSSSIVEQFGDLENAQVTEDGIYRIEYRTKEKQRKEIQSEVYTISKALRSKNDFQQISVFAKKGPGRGMVIHINSNTSTVTLSEFLKTASITYLD